MMEGWLDPNAGWRACFRFYTKPQLQLPAQRQLPLPLPLQLLLKLQ
jgi:hypothetical protein